MRVSVKEALERALEEDNTILTPISELKEASGYPTPYLTNIGLSEGILKRLERDGYVIRGYTQNYWESGDTHPFTKATIPMDKVIDKLTGQEVPVKVQYRGKGMQTRWILIKERIEPCLTLQSRN